MDHWCNDIDRGEKDGAVWGIVTDTTFRVRFCQPLVLLIKVGWRQGKALGSEECRVTG